MLLHACVATGTPALLTHHPPPSAPQVPSVWALPEVQALGGTRYHDLLALQCGVGEVGMHGIAAAAALIVTSHPCVLPLPGVGRMGARRGPAILWVDRARR